MCHRTAFWSTMDHLYNKGPKRFYHLVPEATWVCMSIPYDAFLAPLYTTTSITYKNIVAIYKNTYLLFQCFCIIQRPRHTYA